MKNILTIAGSDSCAGAGIQADLKTFSALGAYGLSVITAVTAQNTCGVFDTQELKTKIVKNQIDCLFKDIRIDATKIGMLSSLKIICKVAESLRRHRAKHIVIDPVMISKSKSHLLHPDAKDCLVQTLFPLAEVVTPNLFEAGVLTGALVETIDQMKDAAVKIYNLGPKAVIIKGGHFSGDAVDIVFNGKDMYQLASKRIKTKNTHGTGCTFSSALAVYLAEKHPLFEAAKLAKDYITSAIEHSLEIGQGAGPIGHFHRLDFVQLKGLQC